MRRIHGVVKHYDWGCPTALPELLGMEPDGRPWAEYWLGTHHGGPATFAEGGYLHEEIGDLPFLVKFLSAAHALSLQTHPSAEQAAAGFADEEARGVPIDAPERLYRDPNAKPEILIALTEFDGLCGFRPVDATCDLLRRIGGAAADLAGHLEGAGLRGTVEDVYRRRIDIPPVIDACRDSDGEEAELVTRMADRYPDDPSAVVTLLLNRIHLAPGEAVYLTPGNLHAYLSGLGVEVMGCSDNVLRGGMTSKYVEVTNSCEPSTSSPVLILSFGRPRWSPESRATRRPEPSSRCIECARVGPRSLIGRVCGCALRATGAERATFSPTVSVRLSMRPRRGSACAPRSLLKGDCRRQAETPSDDSIEMRAA